MFFKIWVLCWCSLAALQYDCRKREAGWVHPFTHSSSQALALSYLEPRPADIVHPTIPRGVPWWGSRGAGQTVAALASRWPKLPLLTWDGTEIIPALWKVSLSILHAGKAASHIDARADTHVLADTAVSRYWLVFLWGSHLSLPSCPWVQLKSCIPKWVYL